ncbi:MAG: RlmE family RNA methyltransferase [Geminicoccaceae bacterium]|nr:RlmE family RNA methyltransferase [Geminicoccaceae bacterium]
MTTTLKRSRTRSHSSTRWLQRQLNDPYVQRARAEGWRARSVYKLDEIDRRFGLVRPGGRVLDLGAAPGSWSQYALKKGARVVAVDLLPIGPMPGAEVVQGDFLDPEVQAALLERLGGGADAVLSDIAPDATGKRVVDRLRMEGVGEAVVAFAEGALGPDGRVLVKLIRGAEARVMDLAKSLFVGCRLLRPKATRADSSEVYLLAERPRAKAA